MLPDDVARFGLFLLQSGGEVQGRQVLDRKTLEATLQRDPADPGMTVKDQELRYNNGMWAAMVRADRDCSGPVWVPFMSGYGGISVVLMPNDSVYYVFSDGAHFKWAQAAKESERLKPYCGKRQP
jgi:CubicO group peptidase (beta-lactamase class C family)